ncbi:Fur family transcriptional regulator [Gehongia tenuis]|uniref:Transcriptional repressor n=1 Tax=Gehongia tenuis TaxID=2763655 RepID=A0A926D345_9FIRM|nr:transcriptional repressor [Gehongia tenuis]MBC8530632.1 transcriptional repressor [Gehongia tenuis]
MHQRNTIQGALVLEAVLRLQCHATADEVYNEVKKEHPHISRGTVYRNLQRLCDSGKIRKLEIPGGADRYDHLCHDHYHVKCVKCGRVFDVDMDYLTGLENAIRDGKGFIFLSHDIVFRGICPKCRDDR